MQILDCREYFHHLDVKKENKPSGFDFICSHLLGENIFFGVYKSRTYRSGRRIFKNWITENITNTLNRDFLQISLQK